MEANSCIIHEIVFLIPPDSVIAISAVILCSQTSSSADSWALVFLSVKIVWTLVFVAQALLFELPSRQRHFTLFNKVRARARDADQPVSLGDLNSRL